MIGLKRNTVFIADYDKEWPDYFTNCVTEVSKLIGIDVSRFHHFGSTSIPDCPAKPIIDVAVELLSIADAGRFVPILQAKGYGVPWTHVLPDRVCMPGKGEITTVNLYLIDQHSPTLEAWLKFKNVLLEDLFIRNEYITLKKQLAYDYFNNRGKYTRGKTDFVEKALCKHS